MLLHSSHSVRGQHELTYVCDFLFHKGLSPIYDSTAPCLLSAWPSSLRDLGDSGEKEKGHSV